MSIAVNNGNKVLDARVDSTTLARNNMETPMNRCHTIPETKFQTHADKKAKGTA